MSARQTAFGSVRATLLPPTVITTALAGSVSPVVSSVSPATYVIAQANLTYGSGGTSIDAYLQTSVDGGATWCDIANFHFLVASARKASAVSMNVALAASTVVTDATLASDSIVNGLIGDRFRVKYKSAGTYGTSTTLQVDIVTK